MAGREQDLVDTLRTFPLFELFSNEQLAWLVDHGCEVEVPEATQLFSRGDAPSEFFVLLEGEIQIWVPMGDQLVPFASSTTPGVWAGLVPYVNQESQISVRVLRDSRFFEIPAADVQHMVDVGFPIAKHLMLGVTSGTQRWQEKVAERERMFALGRLSAGLAHELNNPASATRRAVDQLRTALAAHEAAALDVACVAQGPERALGAGDTGPELATRLADLRAEVDAAMESAARLSPLQRSDREDAVADWLVDAGLEEGHDVAATLVDAGLGTTDLDRLFPVSDGAARGPLLRWLVASTESAVLIREVESSTTRISDLVKAVKTYSYMDRAGVDTVDVSTGLDDTLKMLQANLQGIAIERDYDPDLPMLVAHGGPLNQVWTNLIDNAADALGGSGTIRLGAHAEGDRVVVTVEDDGPGIPADAVHRIFEPFFTTKAVGEGTGLGLDIARRIVTDTSGGELTVDTQPGRTVFRVSLPLEAPPA